MYILSNILRSKDNHSMKFGQLIEYNMRIIFLEKSCPECGGETSPRQFSGKLKLEIFIVCFNRMPSWGILKYIKLS